VGGHLIIYVGGPGFQSSERHRRLGLKMEGLCKETAFLSGGANIIPHYFLPVVSAAG
jgi:hypothetical protein